MVVKGPDRRLQGIITRPLQSRSSRRQEDNVYGKLRSDAYWRIAGSLVRRLGAGTDFSTVPLVRVR